MVPATSGRSLYVTNHSDRPLIRPDEDPSPSSTSSVSRPPSPGRAAPPSKSSGQKRLAPARPGPPPEGGLAGIEARRTTRDPKTRLEAIQTSARGWQTAQVAILGLLGVSGMARDPSQVAALPKPVTYVMAGFALAAFAAASSGAYLIARSGWPIYHEEAAYTPDDTSSTRRSLLNAQRRMRRAIPLTVVALIAMGAAFALSWWPIATDHPAGLVQVRDVDTRVCGELKTSSGVQLVIEVGSQAITLPLRPGTTLEPVSAC